MELFKSSPPKSTSSSTFEIDDTDVISASESASENVSMLSAKTYVTPNTMILSEVGSQKSNTATAAMGFANKKQVWGTALASMLVAMMRYYITKTGKTHIMMDEVGLMKTCINLAPVL